MNLKRGLFRIWLVISAAWLLVVAGFAVQYAQNAKNARSSSLEGFIEIADQYCRGANGPSSPEYDAAYCADVEGWIEHLPDPKDNPFTATDILFLLSAAILPVVALLGIGWLIVWIGNGFAATKR